MAKTSMFARTFKDVDSQADRYRDNIAELEALQTQGDPHNQTTTLPGIAYPTPVRESVFERNRKHDGVQYQDNKTLARRF